MAKGDKKLVKYPKKPKAGASVSTMQKYLERCKEVDKKNAPIKKHNKDREALRKRVDSVGKAK